jgi:hypothetical protein
MRGVRSLGKVALSSVVLSLAALGALVTPARSATPSAPAPNTSLSVPGDLYGVAVTSPSNAWAVGVSFPFKTLLLHWNGVKWSQVTSPKPLYGQINAIAAVSADNAWAVGATNTSTSADTPLVLHWNGKEWARQPDVPAVFGALNGVAVSGSNVWAVGETYGLSTFNALVLRRTGNRWYVVPTGTPQGSGLYGIAVTSGGTAWTDGTTGTGKDQGLVLRWTGTAWKPAATPLQGANNALYGLAAGPDGALWAVGVDYSGNFTAYSATSMLWNGRTWRKVPVGPLPGDSFLETVTFGLGGTAWAVGGDGRGAVSLRWTGRAWIQIANPEAHATGSALYQVAFTSAGNAWGVGRTYPDGPDGLPETLILHWNGKTWS